MLASVRLLVHVYLCIFTCVWLPVHVCLWMFTFVRLPVCLPVRVYKPGSYQERNGSWVSMRLQSQREKSDVFTKLVYVCIYLCMFTSVCLPCMLTCVQLPCVFTYVCLLVCLPCMFTCACVPVCVYFACLSVCAYHACLSAHFTCACLPVHVYLYFTLHTNQQRG